ncbi:MAG: hypothetical protein PVJ86_02115 [Phycisphaerales bacterium]
MSSNLIARCPELFVKYSIGELPAKHSLALVSDTFGSGTWSGASLSLAGAGLKTAKTGLRERESQTL